MKGKIVLITGANSGIGKATAVALAKMGAKVVMMTRLKERGEIARQEVIATSGNSDIDLMQCDLADMASIRSFAAEFHSKYEQLDVLINNAGIYVAERQETADGFEYQIGVNHLGHFLLTHLLMDLLKKSAPARIINVSSGAHIGGRINFDDLHLTKRYSSWKSYAQSKLANVLFTYELARRLEGTGVTANCLHPGFVKTRFAVDRKTEKVSPMMKVSSLFSIPPEKGAETSVYLASSPEVEGVSGKYFVRMKAASSGRNSYDPVIARKLWDLSVHLTKLNVEAV